MFMNLAHRGASTYAPENTFAAFYLGLQMGATGLETDIKRTRDGVLVLAHDDTTGRICDVDVSINDCTYKELFELDLGSHKGAQYQGERIVLLEDFLKVFGARRIFLALELKDALVEADTAALIQKYVPDCSMLTVTSFGFDNLARMAKVAPHLQLGYLTDNCLDEDLDKVASIGGRQICPHAQKLTRERVAHAIERGFTVRSWGNDTVENMMRSLQAGVHGMTVNFPDLLVRELARRD